MASSAGPRFPKPQAVSSNLAGRTTSNRALDAASDDGLSLAPPPARSAHRLAVERTGTAIPPSRNSSMTEANNLSPPAKSARDG
jgi:hypothetical protein